VTRSSNQALGLLAVAFASLALAACGFTPLYAEAGMLSHLASVDVIAPEGRAGFLIREHLDDALARDHSAPAAYSMRLSIAETRVPLGRRTDNVASRYEYILTADYTLANLPGGDVVKKGRVSTEVTYDSADAPYASVSAEQDAQDRATTEAARLIKLQVAVWLATGEARPPRRAVI
jgi:LPS-assembly lipoprotein